MTRKLITLLATALLALACTTEKAPHAAWTYDAVLYEVNVRQFSEEGSFKAVEAALPRLKELGVDILWLMPVYPIGEAERKGSLGSYYAVKDYQDVNPQFGTMADFESLLAATHAQGMKLILDWVPNHTAPDHRWITEHPDYYKLDSLGRPTFDADWNDTRTLNYANPAVPKEMDKGLRFWLKKGVDGFRCDMAGMVPTTYWEWQIPAIRKDYPQCFWLAEAEDAALSDPATTFDATYSWELHHLLNDVAQGKKPAQDIRAYIEKDKANTPATAFRMMFTTNHDENSWAGTEFERMGLANRVMAVLCFTLPKGLPLIYTGQEIGWDHRFLFFEKDPVTDWTSNTFTTFYQELTALKHAHPALAAGERGGQAEWLEGYPEGVLAFRRSSGDDAVTVIANLTPDAQALPDGRSLEPWGYIIEN